MSIFSKISKKKEEKVLDEAGKLPEGTEKTRHFLSSTANTLLLDQPWITEKTTRLSKEGKYVFIIDKRANKAEAKRAIEAVYRVNVDAMRMVNIHSRKRRLGRTLGRKSGFKKAIVTLRAGETIDIMPH